MHEFEEPKPGETWIGYFGDRPLTALRRMTTNENRRRLGRSEEPDEDRDLPGTLFVSPFTEEKVWEADHHLISCEWSRDDS